MKKKSDIIRVLIEVPVGMRNFQAIVDALYLQRAWITAIDAVIYDHNKWSEPPVS